MSRTLHFISFCCLALFSSFAIAQKAPREIIYMGCYSNKGEGIYSYEFDRSTRTFKPLQVLTNKNSPSFLEFHPNKKYLYSANEGNGTLASYQISPTGILTKINEKPAFGSSTCHISVDPKGRFIYASNYGTGNLAVYRLNKDGSIGELADTLQDQGIPPQKPRMHSIIPSSDGRFVYASDLGIDKIMIYAVNPKSGKLTPAAVPFVTTPAGAGPRHFALHPSGDFAYSVAELSSTVIAFRVNKTTGALTRLEIQPMLPDSFTGKNFAADIHVSPDGRFLYASNRGHESLAMYAIHPTTGQLTLMGHQGSGGKHPRNFCIDYKGEFIWVANRDNSNVVLFERDPTSGALTPTGKEMAIPAVVCVKQLIIP